MAGSIFTGDVIKSQLEDANRNYYGQRTWAKLFGDLNLSKQLGTENLMQNYGTIMGEAYAASKANQSAILGSNLGQGFKQAALEENQLALDNAYDSYMSQYLTEQQELNTEVAKQQSSLNKELDTLADMTAKYGNAHFDYLQSLWDKYEAGELTFNPFELTQFQRFLKTELDDNGNEIKTFKPMSEIQASLFDAQGNLTQQGVDFFDTLEHDQHLNPYSFADYLSETDEELYEWGRTENPYNFAPNAAGLNINDATFRQMVGQSSVDEQYNFLEKAYGMEDGEIKNLFADLETKSVELIESLNYKGKLFMRDTYRLNDREISKLSGEYVEGLKKIAGDLGMSNELARIAADAGYENIDAYVNKVILDYVSKVKEGHGAFAVDWSGIGGSGTDVERAKSVANKSKENRDKVNQYKLDVELLKSNAANVLNSILSDMINRSQRKND